MLGSDTIIRQVLRILYMDDVTVLDQLLAAANTRKQFFHIIIFSTFFSGLCITFNEVERVLQMFFLENIASPAPISSKQSVSKTI